ncbi:MAG: hypothetical protein JWM33_2986 [Caulobacteraceae bacterium]|jgi:hypothetical protein|nr:hypothetical protein [Caulobacteraceae bacterium]
MHISCDDIDVEVIESTTDNEDEFGGRWGWFWHESHSTARGPFGSPAEAVTDFAEWIAKHDPASPAAERPDEAGELALVFLANADGFLKSAQAAAKGGNDGHVVLSSCCYALELILKGYLLSRGRSDLWNQQHIRHDLQKAWREATHHGLPDDDARIERFLKAAAGSYARHELFELSRERPTLLADVDYLIAIQVLHQDVERRLPGGLRILHRQRSPVDANEES